MMHPAWQRELCTIFERLIRFASRIGYTVSTGPTPNALAQGHVRYNERRIWVDTDHPIDALCTLLHELGHALAAHRMGYGIDTDASERELATLSTGERRAYLYGWALAVRSRASEHFVSRELWRSFHEVVLPEVAP